MAIQFLDNILAPLRRASPSPTKTLGVSGTAIWGGKIQDNELNPKLKDDQKYKTYSDILANVSVVSAGTRYFLNLLGKAEWRVQPAEGSGVNQQQAEFFAELVDEIIHDMTTPWFRVVRRAAMYRFYGFSIQEWTAKRRDDGVLAMMDIEARPQHTIDRWDVDTSGTVFGAIQESPQTGQEIYLPRGKLVYVVDDTLSDSPEGFGIFRNIAESATRLQEFQKFEAYGYEMDLRGVPVMRAPIAAINAAAESGDISKKDAAKAIDGMKKFLENHSRRPDQGLLLDSAVYQTTDEAQRPSNVQQWSIETMDSGSAESALAINTAIERINREIARVMGVEHLLLGGDGKGSMALSRDKTNNFGLIVDSTLQELRRNMEDDVLGPLWQMNGWDEKLMPEFRIEQIQYRDIEQISQVLKDVSDAALMPDDPATNEIRGLLGLSDQPEIEAGMLDLMTREDEGSAPDGNKPDEVPADEDEEA